MPPGDTRRIVVVTNTASAVSNTASANPVIHSRQRFAKVIRINIPINLDHFPFKAFSLSKTD
jgi:hypothetical protein